MIHSLFVGHKLIIFTGAFADAATTRGKWSGFSDAAAAASSKRSNDFKRSARGTLVARACKIFRVLRSDVFLQNNNLPLLNNEHPLLLHELCDTPYLHLQPGSINPYN